MRQARRSVNSTIAQQEYFYVTFSECLPQDTITMSVYAIRYTLSPSCQAEPVLLSYVLLQGRRCFSLPFPLLAQHNEHHAFR